MRQCTTLQSHLFLLEISQSINQSIWKSRGVWWVLESIVMVVVVGVWCGRGAIQCYSVSSSACWEHRWVVLYWQRGSIRHLLPDPKAHHSDLRRPQPPRLSRYLWHHHLSPFSWPGMNFSLPSHANCAFSWVFRMACCLIPTPATYKQATHAF